MIFALVFALLAGLGGVIAQATVAQIVDSQYFVTGLAIIGCVLLVLVGYVWDSTLHRRLREITDRLDASQPGSAPGIQPVKGDDVINLAQQIETMARSLQKMENRYKAIIEDQTDAVCRYRPDGMLTFANAAYCQLAGIPPGEFNGHYFFLHTNTPESAGFLSQLNRLTHERRTLNFEHSRKGADGVVRWHQWVHRSLFDERGVLVEYQAVGRDITAAKDFEARLLRAKEAAEAGDRAKSEFLAVMSHEIRTPMNGILGFATLLAESGLTPGQKDHVRMITSSGESLLLLLNDLLDISKIEAGKIELEVRPLSLSKCVEDVYHLLLPSAKAKGLELTMRCAPETPEYIYGDINRLRQILLNLVSNAVKFTERGSVAVDLVTEQPPQGGTGAPFEVRNIRLSVRDTGIGIPEAKVGRLFRPFSQVDSSSTRRYGGTGLGLAIAKRLAEIMGGTIAVETAAGCGSTFTVSIPVVVCPGDEPPSPTRPEALRALIAVANAEVRRSIEDTLRAIGIAVHAAHDAASLPALVGDFQPAMVLIDIPESGAALHDLVASLRPPAGSAAPLQGAPPVRSRMVLAACTRPGPGDNVGHWLDAGLDSVLVPPVRVDEFAALLNSHRKA